MNSSQNGNRSMGEPTPVEANVASIVQPTPTPSLAPVFSFSTPAVAAHPVLLAQRAVDAVIDAAHSQQASDQPTASVRLTFSVGGESLAVHVQMRDGLVHTEFRTDSADLRTALSNEWDAASSRRKDTGVRLTDPVFSSASPSSSGGQASNGQNASKQHQQPETEPLLRRGALKGVSFSAPKNASTGAANLSSSRHLVAVA